ncbi:MAG: ATP-binding protein [Thermodesulfobacteriota bacterium]
MRNHEILLALSDDASPSPSAMISALQEKGYQATATGSGDSAIETLNEKNFALVVTDSLRVLERAKGGDPAIMAILMLDISHQSISTIDAIRPGADDYLFKPFELAELAIRVAHLFEKSRAKQIPVQPEPPEDRLNEKILNMLKLMSHDIRGSLVSISATLKLLNRGRFGKMDEGVANRLKELFSRIIGLIGMTEEYLEKTSSVDDEPGREGELVDLSQDIIWPVLRELAPELRRHRILIDKRLEAISSRGISLRMSRVWLKTIFRNLLKNAIKYGGKECTIVLGFEDRGACYQLNVFNSGKPIPEEGRDKLFSEWVRIGKSRDVSRGAEGLGLGLYLIKELIQKQGGDIWYEAHGDGSNFIFTLPSGPGLSVHPLLPVGTHASASRQSISRGSV